ncbi:enoyl-CoA hydratase/isomerase family protein [Xylophilus sp. GW821-FHT01B05]
MVLLDRPAPQVARLRINRPDKRNAIDHAVRQALVEALLALRTQTDVRALVFGGVAGVFSAGGDLPTMVGLDEAGARERLQHIHGLCRLVAELRLPVVSAIEGIGAGAAIGLALLGDQIVVGKGTKILFPFLRLGLAPDWGQLLTLPRRVGLPAARRILTAGAAVTGPEAERIGLADVLVNDDQVMDEAVRRAIEAARLPSDAFVRMKNRLNNVSGSLDAELAREEADQVVCLLGREFKEGFAAFRDKREADFIALPGAVS